MEQRSERPNGRLSGSETNQSKCRDAMRWTDKPERARLRLHSSQPSQWEASYTDGKEQGRRWKTASIASPRTTGATNENTDGTNLARSTGQHWTQDWFLAGGVCCTVFCF